MIIPLGDDNRDRRSTPIVTYVLIGLNVLVFVLFQQFGGNREFTYRFATVPQEIVTGEDIDGPVEIQDPVGGRSFRIPLQPTPISVYITLLTSMFMHGGFGHIIGNMLYLFIFGDNIEDRMGRGRYILFYLLTGVVASLAHVAATVAFNGNPYIPSLGASGAISGVLGGYIVLFPRKRVMVLLFRFLTYVPAVVALGIYFAYQLILGVGALGSGSQAGGVAYAAHIGGFVAGVLLVKLFSAGRQIRRR
jgi:membrane associated rhomboid family serine protease